jgi:hypothetical protein
MLVRCTSVASMKNAVFTRLDRHARDLVGAAVGPGPLGRRRWRWRGSSSTTVETRLLAFWGGGRGYQNASISVNHAPRLAA